MGGGLGHSPSGVRGGAPRRKFGPKRAISSKFWLGKRPHQPRMAPGERLEHGAALRERSRTPLLVGLSSGLLLVLLLVLLPLLRPRACQPC